MIYSVALTTDVHEKAISHLVRADGQEDLCFALWHPSHGKERTTALLCELILPRDGERLVHGNASFLPDYFERALGLASNARAGLAFLHSHPFSGWQGMSDDDIRAEQGHAAAAKGATGFPLVGMTTGNDGSWSARFWEKTGPGQYQRRWCRSVRVVGERLRVTYHPELVPAPALRAELIRTVSAWGPEAQAHLARLHIGIIGAGSVGCQVAEALARMGIARIRLMDFDSVEVVNLDRLLHATREDAASHRGKVDMLADALRKSGTAGGFQVEPLEWSVAEEEGFRSALDCDVLFSCVDRPWPRSVLNFAAYAHLIPVVDGGVLPETKPGNRGLVRADWRAHVAAPSRRCLSCLRQYASELVQAEREGYLDDPTYIAGLPEDHPIKRNENVFAFSMAASSLEVLQLLSMVIAPLGLSNPGAQMYHFVTANFDTDYQGCEDNCLYPSLVARGDSTGLVVTGRHLAAVRARRGRQDRQLQFNGRRSPSPRSRWWDWLWGWLPWSKWKRREDLAGVAEARRS
jgi:molybdopterin-synthase adenylyltransferase